MPATKHLDRINLSPNQTNSTLRAETQSPDYNKRSAFFPIARLNREPPLSFNFPMFSNLVTAARGLFVRPESTSEQEQQQGQSPAPNQPKSSTGENMVTATRRSTFPKPGGDSARSTPTKGSLAVNGKRKSVSSTPDIQDSHATKRLKRPQVEVVINSSNVSSNSGSPEPTKGRRFQIMESVEIVSPRGSQPSSRNQSRVPSEELVQDSTPTTKKPAKSAKPTRSAKEESDVKSTHVRFDSEEPAPKVEEAKQEETTEQRQDEPHQEEEDSDDEAPEAISNITQLQQLKDEERKREQAKQQYVFLPLVLLRLNANCFLQTRAEEEGKATRTSETFKISSRGQVAWNVPSSPSYATTKAETR